MFVRLCGFLFSAAVIDRVSPNVPPQTLFAIFWTLLASEPYKMTSAGGDSCLFRRMLLRKRCYDTGTPSVEAAYSRAKRFFVRLFACRKRHENLSPAGGEILHFIQDDTPGNSKQDIRFRTINRSVKLRVLRKGGST